MRPEAWVTYDPPNWIIQCRACAFVDHVEDGDQALEIAETHCEWHCPGQRPTTTGQPAEC